MGEADSQSPEGRVLRMHSARVFWTWVALTGGGCLAAGILVGISGVWPVGVCWLAAGLFIVYWGVGGTRAGMIVTQDALVIRNALRVYSIPWREITSIDVWPVAPNGRATTCAVVRAAPGRSIQVSATNLQGWIWKGRQRWDAVAAFIAPLKELAAERRES